MIYRFFTVSLILLHFLCLVHPLFSQGSWERLDIPTENHLRSVFFSDSLYGWISGDSGTMLHSSDGGDSWVFQDVGTENKIVDVFFIDREIGWAVSWNYDPFFGTMLHKTTDGGENWSSHPYTEENIFINHILFFDTMNGWVGGSPHALARTSDGGASWKQASVDTSTLAFFPVLKIVFFDEHYGYASGGMFDIAGVTWSTSDGGNSWTAIKPEDAPADEVHGLYAFDSLTVLGSGGDPELGYGVGMIRTHDGGEKWEYEELSMPGAAYDLDFRNDTEAWAPLGVNQKLIYSLDAGSSWTRIDSPENTSIFDMIFPDSLHGYGVGYNGSFIRYIPLPVGFSESFMEKAELRIYPNPTKGKFTVNLISLPGEIKPGITEVYIYDLHGKLVFNASIRDNPVEIDLAKMPSGTYLIQCYLRATDQTVSNKIFLR
jgi:photosystem II stability/assembly factor-like uncharacterized protein